MTPSDLTRVNKVRKALSAISHLTEFTGVLPESEMSLISQMIPKLIPPKSEFGIYKTKHKVQVREVSFSAAILI